MAYFLFIILFYVNVAWMSAAWAYSTYPLLHAYSYACVCTYNNIKRVKSGMELQTHFPNY